MFDGGSGSRGFEGVVSRLQGVEVYEADAVEREDEPDAEDDIA